MQIKIARRSTELRNQDERTLLFLMSLLISNEFSLWWINEVAVDFE